MGSTLNKHIGRIPSDERMLERAAVMDERIHGSGDLTREKYVELDVPTVFWIFVIVSVGGLIGETLVSYPIDGVIKNRAGLIWGPFSPLYGLAGVLFTLALNKNWRASVIEQFLIGALVGGLTEGTAGYLLKNLFGIVAWSYLDQPLNIYGFTSVPMMCVWGMCGLFWFRLVLPVVCRGLIYADKNIKPRTAKVLTAVFMLYMALNIAMTLTGFGCWFNRLEGNAPENDIESYFAEHYDNDYMSGQFGALSMFTEIANHN